MLYLFIPPTTLETTDLFPISIIFLFPECCIVGLMQYIAFSDWIISVSNMHLKFLLRASLVAQTVKNLPAMFETQVWLLGWEDPWRREWLPTPVFLPGEFHGQGSLLDYSPWCHRVRHDWATNTSMNKVPSCLFMTWKLTYFLVLYSIPLSIAQFIYSPTGR